MEIIEFAVIFCLCFWFGFKTQRNRDRKEKEEIEIREYLKELFEDRQVEESL